MFQLRLSALILLALILTACNIPTALPPAQEPIQASPALTAKTAPPSQTPQLTATPLPSETPLPTVPSTNTPTFTPTSTDTLEPTSTFTETITSTSVPTYTVIRGQVIIDQAVCHYGPGAPYLYKFGVYKGSNLEILRRVAVLSGDYVEIQAIGGNNRCWVKAEYFNFKGDLANVEPVQPEDVSLPMSPYYSGFVTGTSAARSGSEVTISWQPFVLRAGDDSEQFPYLIESWVCQGGQPVFYPVGTYTTSIKITDEPGCAEPSHARIYAVEKHGYTRYVEIPWPP